MKYSAVLVAALAAGAMARAVPEEFNPIKEEQKGLKETGKAGSEYEEPETTYPEDKYPKDDKKDKYPPQEDKYPKDDKKDKYKPAPEDKYKPKPEEEEKYKKEVEDYNKVYYKPVDKHSYEERKKEPEYKPYSPEPPKDSYDEEKSCYDKFKWPTNVHKEKPCNIEWKPKHGGEWKDKEDDTVVYLYHCKDYSKPHSKVCDDCGKGSYDKWTPPKECESSDSEGGAMYRFKFVKKNDESSCTWGEEFPIYGEKYDDKKEAECPPPAPVPECPPAPAPPAPVKEEAAPAEKPAAPEAPAYPTAEVSAASANETTVAPTYVGASSAIRASFSVIVGVAALVTFAL